MALFYSLTGENTFYLSDRRKVNLFKGQKFLLDDVKFLGGSRVKAQRYPTGLGYDAYFVVDIQFPYLVDFEPEDCGGEVSIKFLNTNSTIYRFF